MLPLSLPTAKGGGGLDSPAYLSVAALARSKKAPPEAVAGVPGSVLVPGWGGEGGGVEARKSRRACDEAGFK